MKDHKLGFAFGVYERFVGFLTDYKEYGQYEGRYFYWKMRPDGNFDLEWIPFDLAICTPD